MGTIDINGRRFAGNTVDIEDGKLLIDGKVQDGHVPETLAVQIVESTSESACAASISCVAGDEISLHAAADCGSSSKSRRGESSVAVTTHTVSGGIRAVAVASANQKRIEKKP